MLTWIESFVMPTFAFTSGGKSHSRTCCQHAADTIRLSPREERTGRAGCRAVRCGAEQREPSRTTALATARRVLRGGAQPQAPLRHLQAGASPCLLDELCQSTGSSFWCVCFLMAVRPEVSSLLPQMLSLLLGSPLLPTSTNRCRHCTPLILLPVRSETTTEAGRKHSRFTRPPPAMRV